VFCTVDKYQHAGSVAKVSSRHHFIAVLCLCQPMLLKGSCFTQLVAWMLAGIVKWWVPVIPWCICRAGDAGLSPYRHHDLCMPVIWCGCAGFGQLFGHQRLCAYVVLQEVCFCISDMCLAQHTFRAQQRAMSRAYCMARESGFCCKRK